MMANPLILWRRGGDSNPGWLAPQQISSLSPSASRTPLRNLTISGFFVLSSALVTDEKSDLVEHCIPAAEPLLLP